MGSRISERCLKLFGHGSVRRRMDSAKHIMLDHRSTAYSEMINTENKLSVSNPGFFSRDNGPIVLHNAYR